MVSLLLDLFHRLVEFLHRRRAAVVVAGAVLVLAGTLAGVVALRPPVLVPAIDAVQGVVQRVFAGPIAFLGRFRDPGVDRERLLALELEVVRLREAGRENERLRRMLGAVRESPGDAVPGRVTGLELDPLYGTAWIDVGRGRGVAPGQAVLTPDGLVGVVDEARGGRSRIRLLRNRDTPVGVRDTRSRVLGVVEWEAGRRRFALRFVPRQADVAEGDTLVSSGLGGVFPPGLPVGTVSARAENEGAMTLELRVEPFARFHRLEEVFVLRGAVPDSAASGAGAADTTAAGEESGR